MSLMHATSYSIKREFAGAHALITGASGYLGSVLLEQLLRTTDVERVYLLLRPRRGQSVQERASKLLQGPLFHKVRDQSTLLDKVQVVAGDISLPGLGLDEQTRQALISNVHFIVHCAADIRLEADIQDTLSSNFEGTRSVLELAASAQCLKALVHVSSAYVNINKPRGSVVDEQIYPLHLGKQAVDAEQIVKELLSSSRQEANQRVETYKQLWGFPNTYTMGKHLAEQLVARYQAQLDMPVAVVRPSLVSAIAGEPYPGYIGNYAGLIGASAAMAIGMYDKLSSVGLQAAGVWDVVPADLVGCSILAAAAAVSAGKAAALCQLTQSGTIHGTAEDRRVVLGYPHTFAADPQAAKQPVLLTSSFPETSDSWRIPAAGLESEAGAATGKKGALPTLSHVSQPMSRSASSTISDSPSLLAAAAGAAYVPSDIDSDETFSSSSSSGGGTSDTKGSVQCQQLLLQAPLAQRPLLIVHAATSTTYPITLMEGWNYLLDFIEAHPPPFRLTWAKLQPMSASLQPNMSSVAWAGYLLRWKVWAAGSLLRLAGHDKAARKLDAGVESFFVHNNPKLDRQLAFSTPTLLAVEAALVPEDAAQYMLVWRPSSSMRTAGSVGCGSKAISSSLGRKLQGGACSKDTAAAAAELESKLAAAGAEGRVEGCGAQGCAEGASAAMQGDISWKRYLHTQMAGVYSVVFGQEVPQQQPRPAAAAVASGASKKVAEQQYIVHNFRRIK